MQHSTTILVAVLCLLLCAGETAKAQDRASKLRLKASPSSVEFGTLRVGARVEANIVIRWKDKHAVDEPIEIKAPPFVVILRKKTSSRSWGRQTQIWFRVLTDKPGAIDGHLLVKRRGVEVECPIQAVVHERSPLSTRVMVAKTPFDGYSGSNMQGLDAWRHIVAAGKLEVHYVDTPKQGPVIDIDILRRVDVLLLASSSLVRITDEDRSLVQGFVCGGGRVIVAASAFFDKTVPHANRIITPFGIEMKDVEAQKAKQFTIEEEIVNHKLTDKVQVFQIRRPSPTRIVDPSRAQVLIGVPDAPQLAIVALATTESGGEIITLGTAMWFAWPDRHKDNARLLRNMLTRSRRTRK